MTGLDLIDIEGRYNLIKTGEKKVSPNGLPENGLLCEDGVVRIHGTISESWLVVSGPDHWFRTSPVIGCTVIPGGYKIETLNSYYKLERVKDEVVD